MPITSILKTDSKSYCTGYLKINNKTIVWFLEVGVNFRGINIECKIRNLTQNLPKGLFSLIEDHVFKHRLKALLLAQSTRLEVAPDCFILIYDDKSHPIFSLASEIQDEMNVNISDLLDQFISLTRPSDDGELVKNIAELLLLAIDVLPHEKAIIEPYIITLREEILISNSLERIILTTRGSLELHKQKLEISKNNSNNLSFLSTEKNAGLEEGQDLGPLDYHFHYCVKRQGKMKRTYNLLTFDSRRPKDILYNEHHGINKYLNIELPKKSDLIYNTCLDYMKKIGINHFRKPSETAKVYFEPKSL